MQRFWGAFLVVTILMPVLAGVAGAADGDELPGWYFDAEIAQVLTAGNSESSTFGLGGKLHQATATDRPIRKPQPSPQLVIGDHVDARTIGPTDVQRDAIRLLAVECCQDAIATCHLRSPNAAHLRHQTA